MNAFKIAVLFLLVPIAAHAKPQKSCVDQLKSNSPTRAASEEDFFVSQIEQNFLEIVKVTADVILAEPAQVPAKANDLLNLKAYWLNQVTTLLRNNPAGRPLPIQNLNAMLNAIGIPAQLFQAPANSPAAPTTAKRPSPVANSGHHPFGFQHFTNDVPYDHESLNGARRSIGFREFEWIAPDVPARLPNQIAVIPATNAGAIVIADLQFKKIWAIKAEMLSSTGFSDGHLESQITYNRDIQQWIVLRKNLDNPTGQLGFGADL